MRLLERLESSLGRFAIPGLVQFVAGLQLLTFVIFMMQPVEARGQYLEFLRLDGGRILHKGWFGVVDHSLRETVDTVLRHSAVWPSLVMRRILAGDPDAAQGHTSGTTAPILSYPGILTFLRFLFGQLRSKLRFHRASLTRHEAWNIRVLSQPSYWPTGAKDLRLRVQDAQQRDLVVLPGG